MLFTAKDSGDCNMKKVLVWAGIFFLGVLQTVSGLPEPEFITGAEQIHVYDSLLKGKSIGVVVNQASMIGEENVVDFLIRKGYRVEKIFSPEHGFRSSDEAGKIIRDTRDSVTGLSVISLYSSKKKPSPEDVKGIDLMVFDLQDVGVRFYTYISTLSYVMESCAENEIPLILFDRPNPNGFYIDGPVLDKKFSSFIGMHPVPVVYGMTIGEYARMVNGEGWLKEAVHCSLTVIPLKRYSHQTRIRSLPRPSPNLTSMNAILLYPSICLFEGTMISVGRGTFFPFEVFGHPELLSGSFSFIPQSIPGMSVHPPYENKMCYGTNLQGLTENDPEITGKITLNWLISTYYCMGCQQDFFTGYFDLLAGTDQLRKQIIRGMTENEIKKTWQDDLSRFRVIRQKYLLYAE